MKSFDTVLLFSHSNCNANRGKEIIVIMTKMVRLFDVNNIKESKNYENFLFPLISQVGARPSVNFYKQKFESIKKTMNAKF